MLVLRCRMDKAYRKRLSERLVALPRIGYRCRVGQICRLPMSMFFK